MSSGTRAPFLFGGELPRLVLSWSESGCCCTSHHLNAQPAERQTRFSSADFLYQGGKVFWILLLFYRFLPSHPHALPTHTPVWGPRSPRAVHRPGAFPQAHLGSHLHGPSPSSSSFSELKACSLLLCLGCSRTPTCPSGQVSAFPLLLLSLLLSLETRLPRCRPWVSDRLDLTSFCSLWLGHRQGRGSADPREAPGGSNPLHLELSESFLVRTDFQGTVLRDNRQKSTEQSELRTDFVVW